MPSDNTVANPDAADAQVSAPSPIAEARARFHESIRATPEKAASEPAETGAAETAETPAPGVQSDQPAPSEKSPRDGIDASLIRAARNLGLSDEEIDADLTGNRDGATKRWKKYADADRDISRRYGALGVDERKARESAQSSTTADRKHEANGVSDHTAANGELPSVDRVRAMLLKKYDPEDVDTLMALFAPLATETLELKNRLRGMDVEREAGETARAFEGLFGKHAAVYGSGSAESLGDSHAQNRALAVDLADVISIGLRERGINVPRTKVAEWAHGAVAFPLASDSARRELADQVQTKRHDARTLPPDRGAGPEREAPAKDPVERARQRFRKDPAVRAAFAS